MPEIKPPHYSEEMFTYSRDCYINTKPCQSLSPTKNDESQKQGPTKTPSDSSFFYIISL